MANHQFLKYYDINEEVTIQCDASERDLGATRLQNGQPVAFASRTLSEVEERYTKIGYCVWFPEFPTSHHEKRKSLSQSDHKPQEIAFARAMSSPKNNALTTEI